MTGVGLALRAWWRRPSFIIDEALLGLNLRDRSWLELLQPLDHMQAAPPGFLLAERALWSAFGADERVLRVLPALALVAAFVRLPRLLDRAAEPVGIALGTWICVTCTPLYVTAATVKPYTLDVAAAVLIPAAWLDALDGGRSARWRAAFTTSVLMMFSLGSWIVAAGTLGGLLAVRRSRRLLASPQWRAPAIVVAVSALAALAAVGFATSAHTVEYMRYFWRAAFADSSWLDWSRDWARILARELLGLRGRSATALVAAAVVIGWWIALRRRPAVGAIAIGIVAISAAVTASATYPAVVRLSHFLLPVIALGCASLLVPLERRLETRRGLRAVLALAVLAGGAVRVAGVDPEAGRERPRQLFAALRAKIRAGDLVYVRYGAVPAWRWYATEFPRAEFSERLGECRRHAPQEYVRELLWLRGGERVWVVFSHSSGQRDHELAIHGLLSAAGRELDRVAVAPEHAERLEDVAWLYDFGDVDRFDAAMRSADLASINPQDPRSCGPWESVAAER